MEKKASAEKLAADKAAAAKAAADRAAQASAQLKSVAGTSQPTEQASARIRRVALLPRKNGGKQTLSPHACSFVTPQIAGGARLFAM